MKAEKTSIYPIIKNNLNKISIVGLTNEGLTQDPDVEVKVC